MNPANGAAGQGQLSSNVRDAVALDKYTVKFISPGPRGLLPEILADTQPCTLPPRSRWRPASKRWLAAAPPPGTGPFKFKAWIPGQEYEVVRNENYWGGAPYLDGVRFRVIIESTSRAAAVQAGDIDVTERLGPSFVQRIKSGQLKGLQFVSIGMAGIKQLVLNTQLAPTSDRPSAQGDRPVLGQRRDHEGSHLWVRHSDADLGAGRHRLGDPQQLQVEAEHRRGKAPAEGSRLLRQADHLGIDPRSR